MALSSSNDLAARGRPGFRAENPEVFYSDAAIVTADDADIAELKRVAAQNPRLRSRLCTHPDPSSSLHEMLIVHHRDAYVRPHSHAGKPESFHLIEGSALVVIFEDDGQIRDVLAMGRYGSGKLCYYRMPDGVFHTILISSEWLVFHETTAGPFDPSCTVFPEWAPDGSDPAATADYLKRLGLEAAAVQNRHASGAPS
jgi:cupin fold WbuC family metalloprotein